MIEIAAETLRMLAYIADNPDGVATVEDLRENFDGRVADERAAALRQAKYIEVHEGHSREPVGGMVVTLLPVPDSYRATTAGRDLLAQERKLLDDARREEEERDRQRKYADRKGNVTFVFSITALLVSILANLEKIVGSVQMIGRWVGSFFH